VKNNLKFGIYSASTGRDRGTNLQSLTHPADWLPILDMAWHIQIQKYENQPKLVKITEMYLEIKK